MIKRKLLFEVEDEEFSASSEEEDGDNKEDNNDSESNEGGEETEGDDDTSNEDNDDFNIDADSDDGDSGDGESDGDDTDNDSSESDNNTEETIENEDTMRDKEIFDSLSPQEQKLKTTELNKLYLELYSNCNYIIDKINRIGTPYEELNIQIKKTLAVLYNLKQMVSDYITNLFNSKSYIENDINFNRYLSILNSVKGIIEDINKSIVDEDENK